MERGCAARPPGTSKPVSDWPTRREDIPREGNDDRRGAGWITDGPDAVGRYTLLPTRIVTKHLAAQWCAALLGPHGRQ
jgi:hypothetical protein